ncbi:MAG: DNA polymerase [Candidatus Taylorbacteria bacterium]
MEKGKKTSAIKTRKRLILLDVHAILHRAYHALPEFSSSKGEPTGGLYGLSTMLLKIVEELKPDYIAACYDLPEKTYRHEAYEGYKAGRKKADDALVSQIIRSRDIFKAFGIPMYEKAGFEADDMLGTIVEKITNHKSKTKNNDIDIVIASGDMDTLQLVDGKKVQVYTLRKGIKDTILYDEQAVLERFGFGPKLLPDYKGLRGDPSDNIIGIKGIGEKTATLLIKEFGMIEEMYKALKKGEERFKKIGMTPRVILLLREGEEEAKFSKMLGEIRRDAPIEFSLPEKNCRDSLNIPEITKLFSELEFRALGGRVRQAFKLESESFSPDSQSEEALQATFPGIEEQSVDPRKIKETAIALWVLDSNITNPGLDEIFTYSRSRDFGKSREIILSELEKKGLSNVFKEIELPLIPVVEKMDERGVKIDKEYLKKLSVTYHKELEKLERQIWKLAGEEFNVNSPKQLGVILFDKMQIPTKGLKKTEGGAKSTRESELTKLKGAHPIIEPILSYRELQKLLSTYIDNIPAMLDSNSRLHTTFIQAGSTTGRMASENPGLQNIPIKTELGRAIRNAFVAEKGFSILALDYSQIELRIAAFLSGDEKLIEIFKKGEDVHTAVASHVFKVPRDLVDKEMRRRAKVINFGIMYGMGVNALRLNLGEGVTRADAQKFYDEYFSNFKTLAEYLDKVKASALRLGYTETFFGRRRYFSGLHSPIPYIKASAERMAVNAPIQGTEADIIKLAMVAIYEQIKKEGMEKDVFPLLQVHDELVFEVKENLVEKVAPKLKKIMELVLDPKKTKGVVCVAEASAGRSWGELARVG